MGCLVDGEMCVCSSQVSADTTLTDSLRVKALSCIAFLIRLKSKVKSPSYKWML